MNKKNTGGEREGGRGEDESLRRGGEEEAVGRRRGDAEHDRIGLSQVDCCGFGEPLRCRHSYCDNLSIVFEII